LNKPGCDFSADASSASATLAFPLQTEAQSARVKQTVQEAIILRTSRLLSALHESVATRWGDSS
jgi:hypothetical protein